MKRLSRFLNSNPEIYLLIPVILLVSLFLTPLLGSGYTNDDSFSSLLKGTLQENEIGLIDYILNQIMYWMTSSGRIFLLTSYVDLVQYIFDNLLIYKISILLFIILDLLAFAYFVTQLTGSKNLGIMAILLTPAIFQFRLYHDPIMGYSMILEFIFMLTILSLIFLKKFLVSGKRVDLGLSFVTYLICLLNYEISYVFFLLHFIILYFNRGSRTIRSTVIVASLFLTAPVVLSGLNFLIRIYYRVPLSGNSSAYSLNLNPGVFTITLLKQCVAALPLSYYFLDPNNVFQGAANHIISGFSAELFLIGTGILVLFILLGIKVSRDIKCTKADPRISEIGLLGFAMLVLPGVMISLSPKYQSEILWGWGYLPVYISYFGLILILVATAILACKRAGKVSGNLAVILLIAIMLIAAVSVLNYWNNSNIVERSNLMWLYPRNIAENAMGNGVMSTITDGSILLVNSNYPWDQKEFYLLNSGKKFLYVGTKGPLRYVGGEGYQPDKLPADALISKNGDTWNYGMNASDSVYYFNYYSYSISNGYAFLSKVNNLSVSNNTITAVSSTAVYLFIRTPYDLHRDDPHQNPWTINVNGFTYGNVSRSTDQYFTVDKDQLTLLASGENWKLYKLSIDGKEIAVNSLSVAISPASP